MIIFYVCISIIILFLAVHFYTLYDTYVIRKKKQLKIAKNEPATYRVNESVDGIWIEKGSYDLTDFNIERPNGFYYRFERVDYYGRPARTRIYLYGKATCIKVHFYASVTEALNRLKETDNFKNIAINKYHSI